MGKENQREWLEGKDEHRAGTRVLADDSSRSSAIGPLLPKGIDVCAAPILLTSLSDHARALHRALERTEGSLTLFAHAYAGAVIASFTNPRVRSRVFVAAVAPEEGESVADVFYREKPRPQAPQLAPDAHGYIWMPKEAFGTASTANSLHLSPKARHCLPRHTSQSPAYRKSMETGMEVDTVLVPGC